MGKTIEAYKITLKIEVDYNDTITYEGKDLSVVASLVTIAQNKILDKDK